MLFRTLGIIVAGLFTAASGGRGAPPVRRGADVINPLECTGFTVDADSTTGTAEFLLTNPCATSITWEPEDFSCSYWDAATDCEIDDTSAVTLGYDESAAKSVTWAADAEEGTGSIGFYAGSFKIWVYVSAGYDDDIFYSAGYIHPYTWPTDEMSCPGGN
jgi:hypothetical protein